MFHPARPPRVCSSTSKGPASKSNCRSFDSLAPRMPNAGAMVALSKRSTPVNWSVDRPADVCRRKRLARPSTLWSVTALAQLAAWPGDPSSLRSAEQRAHSETCRSSRDRSSAPRRPSARSARRCCDGCAVSVNIGSSAAMQYAVLTGGVSTGQGPFDIRPKSVWAIPVSPLGLVEPQPRMVRPHGKRCHHATDHRHVSQPPSVACMAMVPGAPVSGHALRSCPARSAPDRNVDW